MSEADYLLIRQAGWRHRSVSRCTRVAMTSSIVTFVLGGFAGLFALISPDIPGAMVAVGLQAVAAVEFHGARRARRADPSAARVLGWNQLALLGLITVYCVMKMFAAPADLVSPEARRLMSGQMSGSLAGLDQTMRLLICLFYGAVIVGSILCQGGMSLYYFTRRKRIEEFGRQTPQWIRRIVDQLTG